MIYELLITLLFFCSYGAHTFLSRVCVCERENERERKTESKQTVRCKCFIFLKTEKKLRNNPHSYNNVGICGINQVLIFFNDL